MTRSLVVVSGGVSVPSSTRLLADQLSAAVSALVGARGESVQVTTLELRELAQDLASMVAGGVASPSLDRAREAIARADALVAVTPTFSGSYSGLFKLFVDVLDPDALNGVPVLVAATAGTARHSLMLDHAMRPLFTYLRAVVIPTGVFAATEDFAGQGSDGLTARVGRAAAELADLMVRTPGVEGFTPSAVRPRRSGAVVPDQVTSFEELLRGHEG